MVELGGGLGEERSTATSARQSPPSAGTLPDWDVGDRPLTSRPIEREGDVLVITRLSRAMRSVHHMLDLVNGTRASDY